MSALAQEVLSEKQTVQKTARLVPESAYVLNVWRYMEYSTLRLIAGWGRQAQDWDDKLAVCYHVWLQAEIIETLRRRLEMFPPHRPELPVAAAYEDLGNAILLAPDFPSLVHAVYGCLNGALTKVYQDYVRESHPVHDKPTLDLLAAVLEKKELESTWYCDFQRRHGLAASDSEYAKNIQHRLSACGDLRTEQPVTGEPADLVGKNTAFRMPETPGRVPHWDEAPNLFPILETEWAESVEARRLYFMIGYFWEMGVAEAQLRWIYYADFMPWEFIYEEARHLWDESRHGNSGLTRLRDFGLDICDVGYSSYGAHGDELLPPMSPQDLYEAFYQVTQIAERGFFKTKTYCFEDFAAGGDTSSAEMMQFDIIDETTHAEYGRKWLSVLAQHAGVTEDWLARGAADRDTRQKASDARVAAYRNYLTQGRAAAPLVIDGGSPSVVPAGDHRVLLDPGARAHYERLLKTLRDCCPLANAATAPTRPNLPM